MSEYTASNGVLITADGPALRVKCSGVRQDSHDLTLEEVRALREFLSHEEDERLGRWRWPENPDYVVRLLDEDIVRVTQESEDHRWEFSRRGCTHLSEIAAHVAAAAYFAAHPEPKPWHDAKDGETWALTVNGSESAWAFRLHEWERISDGALLARGPASPAITAGRRIWPEATS